MPRKLKGNPLGFFNIHFGGKLQKTERGTLWSPPVLYGTRLTFLVQFPWPTGAIINFVELLVKLFWSLQVVLKTPLRKVMTIAHSFLNKSAN